MKIPVQETASFQRDVADYQNGNGLIDVCNTVCTVVSNKTE
jgi:hypothetical protein